MKFQSELNYFKNIQLRRKYRLDTMQARSHYTSLSMVEKIRLLSLNERLKQLENKFTPILTAKYNELKLREADHSDWMDDFNLSLEITFYLREDDDEYEEDDDNILMQIIELGFNQGDGIPDFGFGATHINHAENGGRYKRECHCYLYHALYDHCNLDWRDLLRIGGIYVDIKVEEQAGFTLAP